MKEDEALVEQVESIGISVSDDVEVRERMVVVKLSGISYIGRVSTETT